MSKQEGRYGTGDPWKHSQDLAPSSRGQAPVRNLWPRAGFQCGLVAQQEKAGCLLGTVWVWGRLRFQVDKEHILSRKVLNYQLTGFSLYSHMTPFYTLSKWGIENVNSYWGKENGSRIFPHLVWHPMGAACKPSLTKRLNWTGKLREGCFLLLHQTHVWFPVPVCEVH